MPRSSMPTTSSSPAPGSARRERKKLPNLVAVDFYRTGDLLKVARTLNGL